METNPEDAVKRRHDTADRFLAIQEQLEGETDRGAVIVAAALLEDALEQMLLARLVPSPERDDELFHGPYAPLSNFSAKIDFAYRVGLIRPVARSSFHLIRKLRNAFAHSANVGGFESQSVCSRLRELFKLNKGVLDALLSALKESEQQELRSALDAIESKDGLTALLELIHWRGVFDLLVSSSAAALCVLPEDIAPLEPLWEEADFISKAR